METAKPVIERVVTVGSLGTHRSAVWTASAAPATDDKKLELLYDYMGRRVRKLVYNYSGGWQLQSDRRFVWDDWNAVMFLDGQNGNAIVASGTYAAANPIRFSTKQWDTIVALGYWDYRYYNPTTGRWLSRDPIGEDGALNLNSYVANRVTTGVDPDGRYIIALGGAAGLGDPPWRRTVGRLADLERQWYKAHLPCTELAPKSLDFIPWPTGLFPLTHPDWNRATKKLRDAIAKYDEYRKRVEKKRQNGDCVCPEYLHIVGFSDGASTIGDWLNRGAVGHSQWTMGFIGTVDLVRIARENPLAVNRSPGADYNISTTVGTTHANVRNEEPSFLGTPGIAGYFVPEFFNRANRDGTPHIAFPGHEEVFRIIGIGMFTDALPQLRETCTCPGEY